MKYFIMSINLIALTFSTSFAAEDTILKDQRDKESYSLGYQVGASYKKQDLEIRQDLFIKGVQEGFSGAAPALDQQERQKALEDLKNRLSASRYVENKIPAEQYRGEGREFLKANAKKPGVVTLPSGLQYKVLKEGAGKRPGSYDEVTVNYRCTLLDGREFDSSYRHNKPATFQVSGVIRGWTEALQLMKEGAKWQLFIPADLAYGERGPLAERTLIFEIELISVQ